MFFQLFWRVAIFTALKFELDFKSGFAGDWNGTTRDKLSSRNAIVDIIYLSNGPILIVILGDLIDQSMPKLNSSII